MKIQTPTEFLTFGDGLCDIYSVKGNQRDAKLLTLCYGDRTVGMKRYYAARAATVQIDRLIQVPQQRSIEAIHRTVIDGAEYRIEQVQHVDDTNPPATLLTLRKVG